MEGATDQAVKYIAETMAMELNKGVEMRDVTRLSQKMVDDLKMEVKRSST